MFSLNYFFFFHSRKAAIAVNAVTIPAANKTYSTGIFTILGSGSGSGDCVGAVVGEGVGEELGEVVGLGGGVGVDGVDV